MTNISNTLAERGARYGKFDQHAVIAQGLRDLMRTTAGWSRCAPDAKQALETIADKIARILNGDPEYADNWHDIAGYASLVDQRINATGIYKPETPVYTDAQLRAIADAANVTLAEPAPIDPTWIDWLGGEDSPVPPGIVVEIKFRSRHWSGDPRPAGALDWIHQGWASDIVAYRVALPDSAETDK